MRFDWSKANEVPVLTIHPISTVPSESNSTFAYLQSYTKIFSFNLPQFGISLIDHHPEEQLYFFLEELHMKLELKSDTQEMNITLGNLQIDMCSLTATFPCLFYTLRPMHSTSTTSISNQPSNESRSMLSIIPEVNEVNEVNEASLLPSNESPPFLSTTTASSDNFSAENTALTPFVRIHGKRLLSDDNNVHIKDGWIEFQRAVIKVDEQTIIRIYKSFKNVMVCLQKLNFSLVKSSFFFYSSFTNANHP